MATKDVAVGITYAIGIVDRSAGGLKRTILESRELGTTATKTQGQVDVAMKAIGASHTALARIAGSADAQIAKTAVDSSTIVNKALDDQIAKLREGGSSYAAMVFQQDGLKVSSAELAAAIKRDSASQIAAMRAVREEAAKPIIQPHSLATPLTAQAALVAKQRGDAVTAQYTSAQAANAAAAAAAASAVPRPSLGARVRSATAGLGGRIATSGASAIGAGTRAVGGVGLGIGALTVGAAVTGLEKSRSVIEGSLAIQGSTGLGPKNSTALSTIAQALGLAPRSVAQAFGTLGGQTTQFLAGNAKAAQNFGALGISRQTALADQNNPLALFDLVTQRARQLPATQQAAVQRSLLGRGSSIAGQLTAGGPLAAQVAVVGKNIPNLNPKQLLEMQENFVKLKEAETAFELEMAQNFGPAISKVLGALIPLIRPLASGIKSLFDGVGNLAKGPVGQGLAAFGKQVFAAGKGLLDAFKPAMPFFQNVLLPLVKGIAIGIGIGLVGAIKLLTIGAQIVAPVLGALGSVLAPLKTAIEDVGKVLGIVFSGEALGLIAKGLGAVVGEIPFLGKALELLLKPVELVGEAISGLYKLISGTFSKVLGFIPGLAGKFGSVLAGVATAIVGAFAAVPDQIGSLFSGLGSIIGDVFAGAVNVVIDVINTAIDGINAVSSAIPFGLGPAKLDHLAKVQAGGSTAKTGPATVVASGGAGSKGARPFAGGGYVPGDPNRDGTLALLAGNEFVLTGDGQSMMDAYAPGLLDHIASAQLPHFSGGGPVDPNALITPKAKAGSKPTPRYINHKLVGNFTEAGWQAYQLAHPKAKTTGLQPKWSTIGATVYDDSGATSSGKHYAHGFAELSPPGLTAAQVNFSTATALGQLPYGTELLLRRGANTKVVSAQKDDIGNGQQNSYYKLDMGRALAAALGVNPTSFKGSVQVAAAAAGTPLSALGSTKADAKSTAPTLANAVASLTARGAFGAGYQQGLQGLGLFNPDLTNQTGVLSSLLSDAATNVQQASAAVIAAGSSTAASSASGKPSGKPAGLASFDGKQVARWIIPWLQFGEKKGWHGTVSSGYRSYAQQAAIYNSGVRPAAKPGQSNHQGTAYPSGAVDVTQASVLGRILSAAHSPLVWAGAKDPVHFSHPHNGSYRRGGPVRRFASGGFVGGAASQLRGIGAALQKYSESPIGTASKIISQADGTDVGGLLTAFSAQLDTATVGTLEKLVATLKAHTQKGLDAIQIRRLNTAINAVTASIGDHVGLAVQGAQDEVDKIGRDKAHIQNVLTGAGIDPSSTAGLALVTAADKAAVSGFNDQIGVLNSALATAKKYGDKATVKDLTDKLNTALGNLDSATAQVLVDWRAGIERAAQDAVDSSTQAANVAQAGEGILSLQQQLAGTDQTPAGGQQMAAYITSTVIPALRQELAAQQADQAAASSVGDTARANADILAELQTQTSILSESKTAQDAIKQNTQPLKQFGGQLAFNFNGQNVADRPLVGFAVGG